jgi:hypothetical protein
MTPIEKIAFPSFQLATAAVATFELRVRMLAETATRFSKVEQASLSTDLSVLIKMVAEYFNATPDETKFLTAAATMRNKLLHLELSRVLGRIESLIAQLDALGIEVTKPDKGKVWSADFETGEVARVDQTSTEKDGIYGWMLENTFNGGFDAVVALMSHANTIIVRLRDARVEQQLAVLKKKLDAETPAESEAEKKKLELQLEAVMQRSIPRSKLR